MKIYLARHGQTDDNFNRNFCSNEIDINETGINQANELKEIISDLKYDKVYASPLLRARHTASVINENRNIEIIYDDRLRERNPHSYQGTPISRVDREEYWNYNSEIKYGDTEDIKEFVKRVYSFIDELKGKEYESVLIVAHSGVSKAFSCYFDGVGDGYLLSRGLKNCELKEYEL